jgi:hypothetical protein
MTLVDQCVKRVLLEYRVSQATQRKEFGNWYPTAPVSHAAHKSGAIIVTSRAGEYRRRAQQCLEVVLPTFHNDQARDILLHMCNEG